ncbi:MAG TPA: transcription termination/antitermination NusG family protein [Bryobacteraceae bacterium]|nr:transcription termination/antitermination NusG family protein [Bryobacteraceae bacterium]
MGEACQLVPLHSAITSSVDLAEAAVENRWYALKVWVRSEALACTGLRHRGFEPYSPVYPERRRYVDRIKVVSQPAFPGYIFCRFDLKLKSKIISCPAVEYIIAMERVPVPIADEDIEAIRRCIEAGARPVEYLRLGQRVRIEYGALTGVEGILTRVDGKHRLTLSVELLQRSLAIQIDADQVQPA